MKDSSLVDLWYKVLTRLYLGPYFQLLWSLVGPFSRNCGPFLDPCRDFSSGTKIVTTGFDLGLHLGQIWEAIKGDNAKKGFKDGILRLSVVEI